MIYDNLLKNFDLTSLKSAVDTLGIDELKAIPDKITIAIDLKKLSDIADKDVAKKTVHDQLVTKVNGINCSKLAQKLTRT